MAKRRSTSKQLADETAEERQPRRKRRFLRRLIVLGVLLVGLLAVAPMMIANSPLRDTLLNWQMPVGGWRIQCERAGLSWIGSQSLTNAAILDPAGNPLVTFESLAVERSLLGLLIQSRNLGTVRIVKPTAYLATRPDGSNVEDFLAAVAKQQPTASESIPSAPQASPTVNLEIVEGILQDIDTVSNAQWSLEQINLTANLGSPGGKVSADGTAVLAGNQTEPEGRVKIRILPAESGEQQLDLLAEGMQLAAFSPWLSRLLGENKLAGITSLDAHATWSPASKGMAAIKTWGRSETNNLLLTGNVLKGDELRAEKLVVPWKLTFADGVVTAEELKLDCDWVKLDAHGALALADLQAASLANLPKRDLEVSGNVSLAKLAKMLPATLQIREGVRVDSGDVELLANSGERDGKFTWSAKASLANLMGQDRGRLIEWKEPLVITAAWVESASVPRLDRVTLASQFAQGDFTTTDNRVEGEFQLDLGQLTQELGQFVDLAGIKARGTAAGKLTLTASEGDAFAADADVTLSEFAVSQQDKLLWEEPQLTVKPQTVGSAAQLTPKTVSTGSLELRGSRDVLTMKLLAPIDLTNRETWSVEINGTGPLDAWAGRLRPWSNAVPAEMSGDAALQAQVTASPRGVEVSNLNGSIKQLHVRNGQVILDEPQVQFSGDGQWNAAERKLASGEFQLASSVVAFRSRDLRFEFPAGRVPVMTGDLAFRTDLERLAGAGGVIGGREASWPRGSVAGVMRFATNSEQVLADFTFDGEQLQLVKSASTGPPMVVWSEPRLHSAGKVIYTVADQRASIENLQVDGQTMQVAGAAAWDKPLANGPLTVNGNLQYDPAVLTGLIANYAGSTITVQGDRVVRFEARGQLPTGASQMHWSRVWQGQAETGWTSASVFGLPISAGKLQGTLAEGRLQTAPLDVSVGDGRLTTNPLAIFDPAPQKMIIPAGPLITDVQISPAVSEQMLKYVAPILAGATRVDGQFSLNLAETQVPLDDPKQTRTAGKLGVHQLTVLPGPMIADLVNIIQQMQTLKDPQKLLAATAAPKQAKLLTMNDQQIEFQVVDGRVYHRQLEFIIDKVPIRSQGSVGFDQTLALMIEIPIQDRWIDGEDALRGLAGQTLQIPIQGTFQNPRVDQRAIADITKQILQSTAREAIGGEINRQLEKLFQGK